MKVLLNTLQAFLQSQFCFNTFSLAMPVSKTQSGGFKNFAWLKNFLCQGKVMLGVSIMELRRDLASLYHSWALLPFKSTTIHLPANY